MIRLREFNMAELEYFIDPEAELNDDLSPWDDAPLHLISDGGHGIEMTLNEACKQELIRHPTVARFMGITRDFLVDIGIDPTRLRFRQHEQDEMAHYAVDCWDAEIEGVTAGLNAWVLRTEVAMTSKAMKRQLEKHSEHAENSTSHAPSPLTRGPLTGLLRDRPSKPWLAQ